MVGAVQGYHCPTTAEVLTLNTNMDVVLGLLDVSCVFVGFGEGVCEGSVSCAIAIRLEVLLMRMRNSPNKLFTISANLLSGR